MHRIQIIRKEQHIFLSADLAQTLGAPQASSCMLRRVTARNGSGDQGDPHDLHVLLVIPQEMTGG